MRAAAVQSSSPAELLETLGDEIGCSLFVCTNACGAVIPGGVEMGEPVREAFRAATAVRGGQAMPGILRLAVGDRTALVTPVPTQRPVSLVAVPLGSEAPAYVILQHVATVVALECERLFAAREESRRLGAEILAGLLDARITPHSAAQRLETQGFSEAPMVAVVSAPAGALSGVLHHDFAERGIRHLLLRRGEHLYCLTAADDDVVATTTSLMTAEGGRAGISDPFTDFATVTSAVREARWALEVARTEGRVVCRYGEQLGAVGPRSLTEAKALVDRVLGPVIAYDRDKGTELIASLAAFLRANRSWQQAAEELHLHKQTLVYRMRRVEELTGRKLADTCTLSDFWFAVRAFELAGA
jgi:purine catabolism regulator